MAKMVQELLGTRRLEDWILSLNIGNVMHLSPLTLQEMNLHLDNSHELTRDAMLEKIILLCISYFCVGTELRFLSGVNTKAKTDTKEAALKKITNDAKGYSKSESEKWQAKAVEMACTFLPTDCPLVGHVIMSYQKHHSPVSQVIPEDEELEGELYIIRPLNEIKPDQLNYNQIIIQHSKPVKPQSPKPKMRPESPVIKKTRPASSKKTVITQ